MDTDILENQNPRHQMSIVNNNCQTVIIGDNNVINLQTSEVQGSLPAKADLEHEKVTNVYPGKPFHVSRTRRKELNEIQSLFSAMTDEDVVRTVYLTGRPGSGKTELARQYGEHMATSSNHTSKPLVITLNANSEESFLKSVKETARKLRLSVGMEQTNNDLVDLMRNLRDFFRGYSGSWLLIIDDMFGGNEFNNLCPRPGNKEWGGGQVLVTTQDNNLVPSCHLNANKMSLWEGMTKEDALALLKDICGVEVDDFAEEIIKELQHLPLALACCATYVGKTRQDRASSQFGWEDFLNLYHENAKLDNRPFSNNNNVYPYSTTTACTMAVKRMAETSDVLRLTFSFLSYCALLPVPLNVLAHHVKENLPVRNDKQPTREMEISEIENEISRCSLLVHEIERSQNVETIKCHQIIYHAFQSVENTKPVEQREIEFVKMMRSLNKTLDIYKEDVLLQVLVRPHLKLFVDHANDMSWNNTAEFVRISMKNGQFLFSTSNMPAEKAIKSLELLYNISLELDVLSDERRCDILANLGFYYLELDREEDALIFLCEAYYMTEGKSEKEWLLLRCRISFHLAQTYYSMDSVDLAVAMMKTSIDLAKIVYIKEEDKIMERFFWLAGFCFSWKTFWKLGAVVKEATEFNIEATDSKSLSRARCLDYLSRIYRYYDYVESFYKPLKFRKYIKSADELINNSLDIYQQVLGADVSSCSEYCVLLAESAIHKLEANPTEARAQFEKAFDYCTQNGDKFNLSWIAARKKHLFDNSIWWRKLFYHCRNLITRGRLVCAADINMCDDILEDYNSGRISPSPRMIIPIRRRRAYMEQVDSRWFCLYAQCIHVLMVLYLDAKH